MKRGQIPACMVGRALHLQPVSACKATKVGLCVKFRRAETANVMLTSTLQDSIMMAAIAARILVLALCSMNVEWTNFPPLWELLLNTLDFRPVPILTLISKYRARKLCMISSQERKSFVAFTTPSCLMSSSPNK